MHTAEVAADARADGVRITYRNRVLAGTEFGRRLYLVVAIVAPVRSPIGMATIGAVMPYGIRRSGYQPRLDTGRPALAISMVPLLSVWWWLITSWVRLRPIRTLTFAVAGPKLALTIAQTWTRTEEASTSEHRRG